MDGPILGHVSPSVDPYASPDKSLVEIAKRAIADVRPYSMVPDPGIAWTVYRTLDAINQGIPGDLVECGTWLGGNSFAMLLAQRYAYGEIRRPVWMYDSFQGMGLPAPQDGEQAPKYRAAALSGVPDPYNQNYCAAPLDEVRVAIRNFGFADHVRIREGWLEQTLKENPRPESIAVLRIDCDWYEPVKCCLEELVPLLSNGGAIILDDYYAWQGCILATHEFLAKYGIPWPIRSIPDLNGAWMVAR